jgi:hypothetical protein
MSEHDRITYRVVPAPPFLVVKYHFQELEDGKFRTTETHKESVLAIGYPSMPPDEYWFDGTPQPVYLTATGWICHGLCNRGKGYIVVEQVISDAFVAITEA